MTLYGEWSNASSTNKASDLSQSSGGAEKLRRSEGSGMLIGDPLGEGAMLALPTASSGERRTHSSEREGTQTPRRERHAHR